jgi:hypothetical protein
LANEVSVKCSFSVKGCAKVGRNVRIPLATATASKEKDKEA